MPILVRPVREQLEHDRVIRLLLAKWKKKLDAEANVGEDRKTSIKVGQMTLFPDLVLNSASPRKLQGVVEVETGESVNNLEAMAQWTHMSKARAPFSLYVPVGAVDQARRLCADHQVALGELWSYYVLGEQVRFTLVQRDAALGRGKGKAAPAGSLDVFETEVLGPLEPAPEAARLLEPEAEPAPAAQPGPVLPAPGRAAAAPKKTAPARADAPKAPPPLPPPTPAPSRGRRPAPPAPVAKLPAASKPAVAAAKAPARKPARPEPARGTERRGKPLAGKAAARHAAPAAKTVRKRAAVVAKPAGRSSKSRPAARPKAAARRATAKPAKAGRRR